MSIKKLAVYCSSSDHIKKIYFDHADALGALMADNQIDLVYGGGMVGLMGEVAKSIKNHRGKTIGVVPEALRIDGVVNTIDDELIITADMHTRKAKMIELADGFIGLAGGFGTLEEMLEVMTLKQLGYHEKPIVFLNTDGYYNSIFEMFEHIYAENFAKAEYRQLYHICDTPEAAIEYLESYQPPDLPDKWFI
ncbi:TIGR00730 family Rossman fold protein [Marinicella sp. S1101]|uniref:LOG family protein n=1 Tax=Marinicella marina TaxID=2996016 RepID=UPI002260D96E|nr:TIGR00730 family Rossman fold protein [Marinicella marina]MCX7553047.1 TIGR00730 family Rossman fold protein [Marinicella marina]MDJ1139593.1 TIGR00730 family Rossman fold protein [Marinicella marina]